MNQVHTPPFAIKKINKEKIKCPIERMKIKMSPTTDDDDKASEYYRSLEDREPQNNFPLMPAAFILLLCLILLCGWYILRSGG